MRWGDYGGYNSDCFYLHLSRCRCAASKASGDTPRDDVQPYTPQEYTPKYDTRQTPQDDIQLCYLRTYSIQRASANSCVEAEQNVVYLAYPSYSQDAPRLVSSL